ncbi:THAP domain-containing protein 1-like [Limulus polyphemus]|uniref:THAP domain-containing protein 1-like n=1 Tax=Limulus polyphemus TaxID=6850 RepID=A0ABM1C0I3_LIMPO|nr:THAP domain-containing protein 1-like [Limulus polyphemus]
MPQCCVPMCTNRSELNPELSFYRFPADDKEKKHWLQAIRRKDFTPTCNSRVCSWHFPDGKSAGPSKFKWNEKNSFIYTVPEKRKKRKLKKLAKDIYGGQGPLDNPLMLLASVAASVQEDTRSSPTSSVSFEI